MAQETTSTTETIISEQPQETTQRVIGSWQSLIALSIITVVTVLTVFIIALIFVMLINIRNFGDNVVTALKLFIVFGLPLIFVGVELLMNRVTIDYSVDNTTDSEVDGYKKFRIKYYIRDQSDTRLQVRANINQLQKIIRSSENKIISVEEHAPVMSEISMGIDMCVNGLASNVAIILLVLLTENNFSLGSSVQNIRLIELFIPVLVIVTQFITLIVIAYALKLVNENTDSTRRFFIIQLTNVIGFFSMVIPLSLLIFTLGLDRLNI